MDQLLSQISGYGPPGLIIAVLLFALRWLFLRYDKLRDDQITRMDQQREELLATTERVMTVCQASTSAAESAAKVVDMQRISIEALKLRLENMRGPA